jgi:uncharacterized membrane protein
MDGTSETNETVAVVAREAHLRSFAKAVSWRFIGSMDTFILSYLVTGNAVWAVSIASAEAVTKITLFYLHERAWRRVPWGRHDAAHHARAVAKGASWRAVATLDTFLLSWLVTGHIGKAATIASFETVTKIALFYMHEQAWARVPWGRAEAPAGQEGDAPVVEAA